MKPFEFHAELFGFRNAVMEALSDNGFAWLSDFGSVDLQHDVVGLEVTGIRAETDARAIEALLRRMFAGWPRQTARQAAAWSSVRRGRLVSAYLLRGPEP